MHRLPIFHDDKSFRDRTEQMFRDMQLQMDQDPFRGFGSGMGRNWPSTMQPTWAASSAAPPSVTLDDGFFQLKPSTVQSATLQSSRGDRGSREILDDTTVDNLFVEDPEKKSRLFQMSFDVKNYEPEAIQVRVEDGVLIVEAKQTEVKDGTKFNKEFCRRIQLPTDVEPEKLTSTLSSDGILSLKAPVPPRYQSLPSSTGSQPRQQIGGLGGGMTAESLLLNNPTFSQMRVSPLTVQMQSQPFPPLQTDIHTFPSAFGTNSNQSVQIQRMQQQSGGPFTVPVISCVPTEVQCRDRPVFTATSSGKRRMDLLLELGRQYTSGDVVVKLDRKKLIVEAVHEEKDAVGRVSKSSMQKEFELFEDVDPATIVAMMKAEGQLSITAMTFN